MYSVVIWIRNKDLDVHSPHVFNARKKFRSNFIYSSTWIIYFLSLLFIVTDHSDWYLSLSFPLSLTTSFSLNFLCSFPSSRHFFTLVFVEMADSWQKIMITWDKDMISQLVFSQFSCFLSLPLLCRSKDRHSHSAGVDSVCDPRLVIKGRELG